MLKKKCKTICWKTPYGTSITLKAHVRHLQGAISQDWVGAGGTATSTQRVNVAGE